MFWPGRDFQRLDQDALDSPTVPYTSSSSRQGEPSDDPSGTHSRLLVTRSDAAEDGPEATQMAPPAPRQPSPMPAPASSSSRAVAGGVSAGLSSLAVPEEPGGRRSPSPNPKGRPLVGLSRSTSLHGSEAMGVPPSPGKAPESPGLRELVQEQLRQQIQKAMLKPPSPADLPPTAALRDSAPQPSPSRSSTSADALSVSSGPWVSASAAPYPVPPPPPPPSLPVQPQTPPRSTPPCPPTFRFPTAPPPSPAM
eukprot:RCo003996